MLKEADLLEGFNAYKIFIALKLHFNSDYDYFKYRGHISATEDSFLKRTDKFFFKKLEKRYKSKDDLVTFFVANADKLNWIGKLTDVESDRKYEEWLSKWQAMPYHFEQELLLIKETMGDMPFNNLFSDKTNHPLLLRLFLSKKISRDALIIFDRVFNIFNLWDHHLQDVVWEMESVKLKKYSGFVKVDNKVFTSLMKKIFVDKQ